MLKELVNRMQGQVRLRVEAAFPERVLNLCGARHLSFWDVEWEPATVFTCRMGRRDSRVLRQAVREMDCTVTVIGREGAPYFLLRFRRRYVLLAGLAALGMAVRLEMLERSPMDRVTPPKKKEARFSFYSPEQLQLLFSAVSGTMMELPVKLAAYLGLRRSEICGLRWENVDLEAGLLSIREVRTEVGGSVVLKSPKTRTSARRLGITGLQDLQQVLRRAWERRRSDDPKEWVVLRQDGAPPKPDQLTRDLLTVVRRQGLPKISLHGLRHSFASVANSQGVPMFDISRTLGHSSMTVTSNIYTHLFDDTEAQALAAVARAIEKA